MKSNKLSYIMGGLAGILLTVSAALWNNYFAPVSVYPKVTSGILHIIGLDKLNKLAFFTANSGGASYHGLFGFQTFFKSRIDHCIIKSGSTNIKKKVTRTEAC